MNVWLGLLDAVLKTVSILNGTIQLVKTVKKLLNKRKNHRK